MIFNGAMYWGYIHSVDIILSPPSQIIGRFEPGSPINASHTQQKHNYYHDSIQSMEQSYTYVIRIYEQMYEPSS